MNEFIVSINDPAAASADQFGPKAANLAALGKAGLPIPDGFCLQHTFLPLFFRIAVKSNTGPCGKRQVPVAGIVKDTPDHHIEIKISGR